MEQFYLEEPSINKKEDAIAYINELKKYSSHINERRFTRRKYILA